MSYAKKNLREVKDSAAEHGLSAHQEARFPGQDLGAEQTGMNFLIVKPGQREAFAHRHRTAEEIYVVIAGDGRVKLDGEFVELTPLDAVRVSPGVARSFEAGRSGLQILIFGPPPSGASIPTRGCPPRPVEDGSPTRSRSPGPSPRLTPRARLADYRGACPARRDPIQAHALGQRAALER